MKPRLTYNPALWGLAVFVLLFVVLPLGIALLPKVMLPWEKSVDRQSWDDGTRQDNTRINKQVLTPHGTHVNADVSLVTHVTPGRWFGRSGWWYRHEVTNFGDAIRVRWDELGGRSGRYLLPTRGGSVKFCYFSDTAPCPFVRTIALIDKIGETIATASVHEYLPIAPCKPSLHN